MVPMKRTTTIISIAAVATVLAGGATYAAAQDTGDDGSVTGDDVDRASAAALAETGNGTVSSVELDDGGYEVEVRLADGTEVDVDLDGDFAVVHTSTDDPDDDSDDDSDDDRTTIRTTARTATTSRSATPSVNGRPTLRSRRLAKAR